MAGGPVRASHRAVKSLFRAGEFWVDLWLIDRQYVWRKHEESGDRPDQPLYLYSNLAGSKRLHFRDN
eukprot:s2720_g3.t1